MKMKCALFENHVGGCIGEATYARGLVVNGVELITSYERVRTGDVETTAHPDPWDGRVRKSLVNPVANPTPRHCPLAKAMMAKLTK